MSLCGFERAVTTLAFIIGRFVSDRETWSNRVTNSNKHDDVKRTTLLGFSLGLSVSFVSFHTLPQQQLGVSDPILANDMWAKHDATEMVLSTFSPLLLSWRRPKKYFTVLFGAFYALATATAAETIHTALFRMPLVEYFPPKAIIEKTSQLTISPMSYTCNGREYERLCCECVYFGVLVFVCLFFYQAYIAVVEFHLSHPSPESSGTELTDTDPDSSHIMYPFSKWSSW